MLEKILPYATAGVGILVAAILLIFIGKVMYKKGYEEIRRCCLAADGSGCRDGICQDHA